MTLLGLVTPPTARAQYVYQRNDVGQTVTNQDGSTFAYPNDNLWTQPYTTSTDLSNNTYVSALTNWNIQTSYPDGAGVTVTIGPSTDPTTAGENGVRLNGSVSFQSLTLTSGALLTIDSSNSGGAGNHAIVVTAAAGGGGTIQNDGTINLHGTDQNTTLALANALTLSGGGTLNIATGTAALQGLGTLTQTADHTILGTGGTLSAPSSTREPSRSPVASSP